MYKNSKKIQFYVYIRVSTDRQDIGRQIGALNEWKNKNNIEIPDNNIFTDYYSGKTFDRENYQILKTKLTENDYLVVKEVDRLGRDWDGIKNEWKELKDKGINIIIIDMSILSDPLPDEKPLIDGLDLRFIKEQVLTLMCYSAQKEREKISRRTIESLQHKKELGVKLGKPRKKTSTKENFIKTIKEVFESNLSIRKSCSKTRYPIATFMLELKELKQKYNLKSNYELYKKIVQEW